MAYPDELIGELPQEKRDGDRKMFQEFVSNSLGVTLQQQIKN